MRIFSETNLELNTTTTPTGTAASAAEKLTGRKGLTLKVDGVVLDPTDKVPTGDVFEVVEWTPLPTPVALDREDRQVIEPTAGPEDEGL